MMALVAVIVVRVSFGALIVIVGLENQHPYSRKNLLNLVVLGYNA